MSFHVRCYLTLMKAALTTTLNETQIKEILSSLSIADCKRAMAFLQKRIQLAEEQKRQKKQGLPKWDDAFLNMSIDEFDLHSRIKNRLRENQLYTVRDVTDLGVENLAIFRGMGRQSVEEIRREIFNRPS